jgi:response regulator RpfG family c-di-GMP phosphodiesterase
MLSGDSMQPITRNTDDTILLLLPVLAFTMLVISTFPRILFSPSTNFILARSILVFLLGLSSTTIWYCLLIGESRYSQLSLTLLCLGIIIIICISAAVYFTGTGEMGLFALVVILVAGAASVGGRHHALILTVFTTASILCNRIVEGVVYSSASLFIFDAGLLLLLTAITLQAPLQASKNNTSTFSTQYPKQMHNYLTILDSADFWFEVANSSAERVTPQTLSLLRTILMTQEMCDSYSIGHSIRVMLIATRISDMMKVPFRMKQTVRAACLFHDIGKIEIDQVLLQKKGPLQSDEHDAIVEHPLNSIAILARHGVFSNLSTHILYHHERYDGCGYPQQIVGSEIPLGARIISVADAIDAMASNRPYSTRKKLSHIIHELEMGKGNQFDPQIIEIAIRVISAREFYASLGYQQ